MNKIKKSLLVSTCLTLMAFNAHAVNGKTFFMPKSIGQDLTFQYAMSDYFLNEMSSGCNFNLFATTFYQESTDEKDLARFFFPCNKTALCIGGQNLEGRDIAEAWMLIVDPQNLRVRDFESIIKIEPKQKSFGINLQAIKTVKINKMALRLSAFMPFVEINTYARLQEPCPKNAPNEKPFILFPGNNNVTKALNNPSLLYSKVPNHKQTLAGLSDINLKLGFYPLIKKSSTLGFYANLTIPTGYKPNLEYIFEPIIGNCRKIGFGGGAEFDFRVLSKGKNKLNLLSILEYNYFVKNNQRRVFDLNNGPLSRYLLLSKNELAGREFGYATQFLNRECKVSGISNLNYLLSLHYQRKCLNLEVGYNIWWREGEKLNVLECFKENLDVTALQANPVLDIVADGFFHDAKISSYPDGVNKAFKALSNSDINVCSAAHPSSLSNKIYLAVGFDGKCKQNNLNLNIGGSYEFGSSNKALDMWALWLQAGIAV